MNFFFVKLVTLAKLSPVSKQRLTFSNIWNCEALKKRKIALDFIEDINRINKNTYKITKYKVYIYIFMYLFKLHSRGSNVFLF